MKTHVFLQARLGSKRLPQKILKKICDKSILELIVERVKKIKSIDKIVLLTDSKNLNESLIKECKKLHIDYFIGSDENILDRCYNASILFKPDIIIRITGDNPLIDYEIINEGLKIFKKEKPDILTVDVNSKFPIGLNFEIFSHKALQISWNDIFRKFKNKEQFLKKIIPVQSHMEEEQKFSKFYLKNSSDLSQYRLTVDYPEDYELIKKVFESLYFKKKYFVLHDIISFLRNNSHLLEINKKHCKKNS